MSHSQTGPFNLASTYLRLRADVSAEPLPVDATFWQRISTGQLGDFHNEYLVTMHSYDQDWPMWEMHPNGDEIVGLLSGAAVFILEMAGGPKRVELEEPGSYVIVPKGTWHTAKANGRCCLFFITPGEGTQHRAVSG
jgi:mannose-6-phosphate isomerase-like protein (cupin superfamily)